MSTASKVGAAIGAAILAFFKGIVASLQSWLDKRKLEEAEKENEAFKQHEKDKKEVAKTEEELAKAAKKGQESAEADAEELSPEEMLEHIRGFNKDREVDNA